jgi:integrase
MTRATIRATKRRPKGSGATRQLPSGRWQASMTGPDEVRRPAPQTFDTKMDAQAWLAGQVLDVAAGTWAAPASTKGSARGNTITAFANDWLETRPLRPSTRALYRKILDQRILPELGAVPIARLTPTTVRRWYSTQDAKAPTARAHAYALLKTIMQSALEDDLIEVNPCKIKGGSNAKHSHVVRPATLSEIAIMTDAIPDRYRAMLQLAAWCGPRSGELRELRRQDIDLATDVMRIRRGVTLVNGAFMVGPTKSEAGVRDVDIPPHVMPLLTRHMSTHVGQGPDALLFPAAHDPTAHMRPSTLYNVFYPAREAAGREDLRWHDLRHTGATLAVIAGASLKDTMTRIGHSTVSAAMIYQHAADGKGKQIAARLSEIAAGENPQS